MNAGNDAKLLIVEDDPGVALLQSKQLTRAGYETLIASTMEEALRAVTSREVDLILLDYSLPNDVTGFELHTQLLSHGHDIPVIMVTGCADEFTSILALRSGVKDFVHKSAEYLDYLPVAVNRVLAQHATERALAESEARFRAVSDSACDGIVAMDSEGRLISWNAGAERIFGYTADEITARDFGDLLDAAATLPHGIGTFGFRGITEQTHLGQSLELQGLRKHGSAFPMELSLGTWKSDNHTFFSGIIRDVTERKRSEEILRQRDEQLRQSQKMEAVGTLAGGLAHEFNNLLQAIQAYTHFAMEDLPPEEPRLRDLEQVLKASGRAADLTRQLLSFGRQQNLERTYFNPNRLVVDLLKMTRPLIGEDIAVKATLDEQPVTIHADPGQFQQMLMNLCLNARDAMPSGGRLLVGSKRLVIAEDALAEHQGVTPGNYFYLTVRDTGMGIAEHIRDHIFDPFFTTKEVGRGTGLGLAMVYGVVQQHGGTIRFDSVVGAGTTFHIYMPTVDAETPVRDEKPQRAQWQGKETLLIAEDEPLVRETFVRILQAAGYRLLVARDGNEAMELFRLHADEIDLLLLDVVMPNMGGWEFHAASQQLRAGIPVIFCSGYDPDRSRADFVKDSGFPLLQKPFDSETLLSTVRSSLIRSAGCLT